MYIYIYKTSNKLKHKKYNTDGTVRKHILKSGQTDTPKTQIYDRLPSYHFSKRWQGSTNVTGPI